MVNQNQRRKTTVNVKVVVIAEEKRVIQSTLFLIRVFHITPYFELSLVLLTTKALGLYEFTKKISAL